MTVRRSVWLGFDPREASAYAVARQSVMARTDGAVGVHGLVLPYLRARGLYTRPTERRVLDDGRDVIWDVISDAPCATEFSISRFLTPILAEKGWALFMDCDMLVLGDLNSLFREAMEKHSDKAIVCVKHQHNAVAGTKMDGQVQTVYGRKNWSSLTIYNVDHPANDALTVEMVNTLPGRDLHQFCWIKDDALIGEIGPEWNYLIGETKAVHPSDVKIAHFTLGIPTMAGYENCEFAEEWRRELYRWAS